MAPQRTIRIIPFHPEHLKIADVRAEEKNLFLRNKGSEEKIYALMESSVQAVTVVYDGRIICCCGFLKILEGVCEVWIIPTEYVNEKPLYYTKLMRRFMDDISKAFKFHRMQTVAISDKSHDKWISWFGFECEGVLRQYTDDKKDYKMWSKIYGG